jgi:hypothetical protein
VAIDEDVFIETIRRKTGVTDKGPTAFQLEDIQELLRLELINISRQLPNKSIDFLTSTAGVQVYVLSPKPDYIFTVYSPSTAYPNYIDADFDFESSVQQVDSATSWFDNPSLFEAYMQQRKAVGRIIQPDFSYKKSTGELTIIPVPTSAIKYWYLKGTNHTMATIPEEYEPALSKMMEASVLEALAMKLSRLAGTSDAGAVQVSYNIKHILAQAKEAKEQAKTYIIEIVSTQGLPLR